MKTITFILLLLLQQLQLLGQCEPTRNHSNEYVDLVLLLTEVNLPAYLFIHHKHNDSIKPLLLTSKSLRYYFYPDSLELSDFLKLLEHTLSKPERIVTSAIVNSSYYNLRDDYFLINCDDYSTISNKYSTEEILYRYFNKYGVLRKDVEHEYQLNAVLAFLINNDCVISTHDLSGEFVVQCR